MTTTAKTPMVRFGVDVDNVLANSSGKAVELLNAMKNFSVALQRDDITVRPFHKSPGFASRGVSQDEVSKVLDEVWRTHYREIELMDKNIPSIIVNLREQGVSIEIITTMGARDETIRPNLVVFLNQNKIPYDKLNFVSGSAEKLAYPVHTIVDDEQELAIGLSKLGRPGLVYDAPWNREFVGKHKSDPQADKLIIPVIDWKDVRDEVLALKEKLRT
jgi:uncharacterized HAD superfamily protein